MLTLVRRYAHVPLGLVSLLLLFVVIAWLLERRVDGSHPVLRLAMPARAAVTIPGGASGEAADPAGAVPDTAGAEPPASPPPPVVAPEVLTPPPAATPVERYMLESGPLGSAALADRLEDQLNGLGFATIRFRKPATARVHVVAVTGFASVEDAQRAAAELGRGVASETEGGAEVVVDRAATLDQALTAARALRARGFDVRLGEATRPTVIYHIRYGSFGSRALAQHRGDELARLGVESRAIKVR